MPPLCCFDLTMSCVLFQWLCVVLCFPSFLFACVYTGVQYICHRHSQWAGRGDVMILHRSPIKVWYKNETNAMKERAEIGLSNAENMKCQLNDRVPRYCCGGGVVVVGWFVVGWLVCWFVGLVVWWFGGLVVGWFICYKVLCCLVCCLACWLVGWLVS